MKNRIITKIIELFERWSGEKQKAVIPLPQSGSARKYFRIKGETISALGVFNPAKKENLAFLSFAKHFQAKGLPVPKIYSQKLDQNIYLIEDLGDQTLFDLLQSERVDQQVPERIVDLYKKSLSMLPKFQIEASSDLDYSLCYPREKFDKQAMLWDLNYFKYYFLKLAGIQFDEQRLENDFQTFTDFLLKAESNHFIYRDFQSRNIMIKDDELFFIDFQGGRKGALQYDAASLLWSARANLPYETREELLRHYLKEVSQYADINKEEFEKYYYGYVLIRILQTLGAYGYRGFYERKDHFLKSIPFAVENLEWIIENEKLRLNCDELFHVIAEIIGSDLRTKFSQVEQSRLKVTVNSFSYKSGIPYDTSGNGGGFVFDCRAIHNPGRYNDYKSLTGKDEKVIKFLEEKSEVEKFISEVKKILLRSVKVYQERGFTNLMVNFGCTGGQHRSVYCAERIADYLSLKPDLDVALNHTELENRIDL